MKFSAPLVMLVAYWILAKQDFERRGFDFLSVGGLLKTVIPTVLLVFLSSWIFSCWMLDEHSNKALLINILLMASSVVVSLGASIPFNAEMRLEVCRYRNIICNKFRKEDN